MQKLAIVLALITIGCIVAPIGTVAIMYRSNPSQMVIPPQLQQMMHFGNNNNSNQNGNNYNNNNNNPNNNNYNNNNNNNNNNANNNNDNVNNNFNSGNVNNNNSPVTNPTNSFGGSYQFDVSIPNNGRQIEDGINTNINCLVGQNGNSIQLSLDLTPTSVPSDLQSVFSPSNDYVFNFAGTTTSTTSGTQINANSQGSLSSGNTFDLSLSGSIDQSQNTLTFSLMPAQNSQVSITTPQPVSIYSNGNNNNGTSNNSNSNSNNNGNNNNSNNGSDNNGINPSFVSGQIDTTKMKITLTFSVTNSLSQSTTINAMSGTIAITDDQYTLGTGNLQNAPVTIPQGQTTSLTISGALTQDGKNNLLSHYGSQTSVDVESISGSFTEDGVTNQQPGTQDIGMVTIIK